MTSTGGRPLTNSQDGTEALSWTVCHSLNAANIKVSMFGRYPPLLEHSDDHTLVDILSQRTQVSHVHSWLTEDVRY